MDDNTVKRILFANVGARALQERHFPKIPKAYNLLVMQSYVKGKNQPIVANESQCKANNNGYSRNDLGGFFAH